MKRSTSWSLWIAVCALFASGAPSFAQGGRLIATGGATQLEGTAGGGLVPWAVLAGYGTREESGGTTFLTYVDSGDYSLTSFGGAVTWRNRIELSGARTRLHLGTLGTALGLPGEAIEMQTVGLKLRLFGDAVYTRTPQISFGLQHKQTLDFEIPSAVGATREDAVDIYVAGTKVFLGALGGRNLLVNTTLRATRANQIGLLGFEDSYEIHPEVSLGLLLDEKTIIGVEYRAKPDNLAFSEEEAWRDFFIGYFPSKHLALVAAYGELGTVATLPDQSGLYLSLQATF